MSGLYIYVASPMSLQPIEGPRAAARVADELVKLGHYPYLPQLDRLWAYMMGEKPYETWLTMDFAWIRKCDALIRCPGESKGADRECAFATSIGKPVYHGFEEFFRATSGEVL
jgi:hypothetical protein